MKIEARNCLINSSFKMTDEKQQTIQKAKVVSDIFSVNTREINTKNVEDHTFIKSWHY